MHFLRREYGTFKLASELGEQQDWAKIAARMAVFLRRFGSESGAWLAPLVAAVATDDDKGGAGPSPDSSSSLLSSTPWPHLFGPALALLGILELLRPSAQPTPLPPLPPAEEPCSSFSSPPPQPVTQSKKRSGPNSASASTTTSTTTAAAAAAAAASGEEVHFLPGGPTLVVMLVAYSVFINCLANLSFSALHINITARMWQQAYFIAYVAVGVGTSSLFWLVLWACDLVDSVKAKVKAKKAAERAAGPSPGDGGDEDEGNSGVSDRKGASVGGAAVAVVASLAVSVAIRQANENWAVSDQSRNDAFLAYGRQLVGGLPPDALLLVNDDLNCMLSHYV